MLFVHGRGLRQGDPLSPFLFNVVVEGLAELVQKARILGFYKGVNVGNEGLSISHLQFARDTLFFCEAKEDQIINVKCILRCFEICSGLKINFSKSCLIGVKVREEFIDVCARRIKCNTGRLPFTYLGFLVEVKGNTVSTWDLVISKIEKKISIMEK